MDNWGKRMAGREDSHGNAPKVRLCLESSRNSRGTVGLAWREGLDEGRGGE